jgi:hypothetical protein
MAGGISGGGLEPSLRFLPADEPIDVGGESRILYDSTNDEFTVQTTDASNVFQDRLRIEGKTNTPIVEFVTRGSVDITRVESIIDGANLHLRHARLGPAALADNDSLGDVEGYGYDGVSYEIGGRIRFQTEEAFTASAHGTEIRLAVVPIGGTALTNVLRFRSTGNLDFEQSSTIQTNSGDLTLTASGDLVVGAAAKHPKFIGTTGLGDGASTDLTAPAQGTGGGPASMVADDWVPVIKDDGTAGWFPFFV